MDKAATDKAAMIVAFSQLGLQIAEQLAWLFQHEGSTFTDAEKQKINDELAKSREQFLATLAAV